MELKMINMKDIVTNPLQPRQEFNMEKLQELADSIYESELLQPIVVRKVVRKQKDKYEVVAGERRFKAFKILKEPKIPAIVRSIKDDTEALEKSCIENWQRDNLKEKENNIAIKKLMDSGKYTSESHLAKKVGKSQVFINQHRDVDEFRSRTKIDDDISYTTIRATKGLDDAVRIKAIQMSQEKQIPARKLEEEIVPKIKQFPEPKQQMEILEEFEEQEETSKEIFNTIVQKKKEIADGTRRPDHYVKIESDSDKRIIEDYNNLKSKIYGIVAIHIQYMKTKELQDEATDILWDIYKYTEGELVKLGRIQGAVDA